MTESSQTATVDQFEIDSLVTGLQRFLIEEAADPLKMPPEHSPLFALAKTIEQLRKSHVKLAQQNEAQTVGEGELEIKRLGQMRAISTKFNDTIMSVIRDLMSRGDEGVEATASAVAAVNEVITSSNEIREVINEIVSRAKASGETVDQAARQADDAIVITEDLQKAADEIVQIVDVIETISFQTNLLALNASIEAARAGEAGKTFAVVANEVKTLSNNTNNAAKRVRETVLGMNEATHRMTDAVRSIKDANTRVHDTTNDMVDAINQQVTVTEKIGHRAEASGTQMTHTENGIKAIQTEANRLQDQTGQFVHFVSLEPGVSDDTVRFGQSAPYSGAVASLGTGTKQGIELAFALAEANGGIHGRRPVLEALDDGYDPDRALENVRTLVRSGEIFGLAGAVGTPTSKLSERIARGGRVPFIGPVTGTGFLRTKDRRHVINVRASYQNEVDALVAHFARAHGVGNCGFFYQADAYGMAVRDALDKALPRHSGKINTFAPYDRQTGDVTEAVRRITEAKPEVIFMAGTAKTSSQFLANIRAAGVTAPAATISFVGASEFARQAGKAGEGTIVSQVVPLPTDRNVPLCAEYLDAMAQYRMKEKPDFAMLEGYVIGRMICEILERTGPHLTREGFLRATFGAANSFNIAGHKLSYGPGDNTGTNMVYLTQLSAGETYRNLSQMLATARVA